MSACEFGAAGGHSTLWRKQKTWQAQIPCPRSGGPLTLHGDSAGITVEGCGKWQARMHDVQGRRQWREVHLATNTAASGIHAGELTPKPSRNDLVLPDLLNQIPETEEIGIVTVAGAYDTRKRHGAILAPWRCIGGK